MDLEFLCGVIKTLGAYNNVCQSFLNYVPGQGRLYVTFITRTYPPQNEPINITGFSARLWRWGAHWRHL